MRAHYVFCIIMSGAYAGLVWFESSNSKRLLTFLIELDLGDKNSTRFFVSYIVFVFNDNDGVCC